jgi:ribosome recycling factor
MNQFISNQEGDFQKAIDFFIKDITSLRTGRAHPGLLDTVSIAAYGSFSPISALANISVPEARCMVIAPWDKSVLKDIEKGLITADLGMGVVNEGDKIRLTIPALNEENRRELVKRLNEKMEEARIVLRQAREEVKNKIEAAFATKEISEDDKFRFVKELDEFLSKKNDELKSLRDKKETEIMTI